MEGSGGLALQVALDRRVVVFGRGRILPERDVRARALPSGVAKPKAGAGIPRQGGGGRGGAVRGGREGDSHTSGSRGGEIGVGSGGDDIVPKLPSRWSMSRRKNA